jgi:hypothetical protein
VYLEHINYINCTDMGFPYRFNHEPKVKSCLVQNEELKDIHNAEGRCAVDECAPGQPQAHWRRPSPPGHKMSIHRTFLQEQECPVANFMEVADMVECTCLGSEIR